MQEFFTATKGECAAHVKKYGEVLETVIVEDIFMPLILELLIQNRDEKLLEDIFNYFEM